MAINRFNRKADIDDRRSSPLTLLRRAIYLLINEMRVLKKKEYAAC